MCIIYSYGKSAVRFRFVSESDNFFIKWTDPLPLVSSVLPGDAACERWRFPGDRPGPATFPFHASRVHPSRSSPNEIAPSFSIHVPDVSRVPIDVHLPFKFRSPNRLILSTTRRSICERSWCQSLGASRAGDTTTTITTTTTIVSTIDSYQIEVVFSIWALLGLFESLPMEINMSPITPFSHPWIRFLSFFFSFPSSARGLQ